jgi:YHS domain-containing protein
MNRKLNRRDAFGLALMAVLAAYPLATAIGSAAAQEAPLAIQGYDPVAYFTDGKPTRGLAEIEYTWDDHRYRFASAAHREQFKADPVRYAPQFGNFCAMALSKGEIIVANPENWLVSEGKLYVFGKPIGPELFQKDLAGNVTKANHNRPILPTR